MQSEAGKSLLGSYLYSMRRTLLLALSLSGAAALGVAAPLRRALSKSQAVVLELAHADPTASSAYDLDELSQSCRLAGVSALVVPSTLLPAMSKEQAGAAGDNKGTRHD